MCSTVRTIPFSNIQILDSWVFCSAHRTGLARSVETSDLNEIASIENGFVFQHPKERTPRNIRNVFREFMILEHSLHVQIFDSDDLVIAHQFRRFFVQEVSADIHYLFVHDSDGDARLLVTARVAFPKTQSFTIFPPFFFLQHTTYKICFQEIGRLSSPR